MGRGGLAVMLSSGGMARRMTRTVGETCSMWVIVRVWRT